MTPFSKAHQSFCLNPEDCLIYLLLGSNLPMSQTILFTVGMLKKEPNHGVLLRVESEQREVVVSDQCLIKHPLW